MFCYTSNYFAIVLKWSHSPKWPRTHCVAKGDLELLIPLPLLPSADSIVASL